MENAVSFFCLLFLLQVRYRFLSGYYLATLEAAIQHIMDIAMQHEGIVSTDGFYDEAEEVFDLGMFTPKN